MKKRRILSIVGIFFAVLLVFGGFQVYMQHLKHSASAATEKTLSEIVMQQEFNIRSELSYELLTMKNIAYAVSLMELEQQTVRAILNQLLPNTKFDDLGFAGLDGRVLLHSGTSFELAGQAYFQQALGGEIVLTDPLFDPAMQEEFIAILVPVWKDARVQGVLLGANRVEKLKNLILPCFEGQGYTFLLAPDGKIITSVSNGDTLAKHENLFETLQMAEFQEGGSLAALQEDMAAGRAGTIKYELSDCLRYAGYMPLAVNNWTIMIAVAADYIEAEAIAVSKSTALLILAVTLLLASLLFAILFIHAKNRKVIRRLAFYDELSGAPTLARFKIEAQRFAEDPSSKKLLMVKFDVQKFKLINQILGGAVGDRVIVALAQALKENTPGKYERFARLHDDEFLVLHEYDKPEELMRLRDRFQDLFYKQMGGDFHYSVKMISGHYYMSQDNCSDVTQAIERANIAHRKAKETGSEICIYDQSFLSKDLQQREIESRADHAIAAREFKVYLQPKCELKNESIVGAEALVRWIDAEGTVTYPNDFIPLFEQNHFITKLDFYMFEETCKIIRAWMDEGVEPIPVSVNFSRLHLYNPKLVSALCTLADQYAVPHSYLEIELTETVAMDAAQDLRAVIAQLHAHDFRISMDDFGTGYSSLGMLKDLDVDVIKLDRSFFLDAHQNVRTHSLLSNLLNMTIDLGIATVAEGVEEKEHVELLRKLNCDWIQGYYFGRPIPHEEFTQRLRCEDPTGSSEDLHAQRFDLRKNNELLSDMMDSMPLSFTLWNEKCEVVQCNQAAVNLLGYRDEAELMAQVARSMPPVQPDGQASYALLQRRIKEAFECGRGRYSAWYLQKADGTPIPCEMVFVRIVHKGNFMLACYARDMRLQIEAENLLKEDRLKLQILMDASPLCFNLWDEKMQNSMCNKAAPLLFDLKDEQEYLTRFFELSPERQPDGSVSSEKAAEKIQEAFSVGRAVFQWQHQKLSGEKIPTEITLVRTLLNGKQVVAGFTRDLRRPEED